jgi:hypothetical protein
MQLTAIEARRLNRRRPAGEPRRRPCAICGPVDVAAFTEYRLVDAVRP